MVDPKDVLSRLGHVELGRLSAHFGRLGNLFGHASIQAAAADAAVAGGATPPPAGGIPAWIVTLLQGAETYGPVALQIIQAILAAGVHEPAPTPEPAPAPTPEK